MLMEPKGRVGIKPLPKFLRINLLGTRVNKESKGWVTGKPPSSSGKEKDCSEKVETHPTDTLASPDDSAINSWRS